jgi:hypothetical protein
VQERESEQQAAAREEPGVQERESEQRFKVCRHRCCHRPLPVPIEFPCMVSMY